MKEVIFDVNAEVWVAQTWVAEVPDDFDEDDEGALMSLIEGDIDGAELVTEDVSDTISRTFIGLVKVTHFADEE